MVFINPLNQKPLSVSAFLLTLQSCRHQTDPGLFWRAHKVGNVWKAAEKRPSRVPFRVTVTKKERPGLLVFLVGEALFLPPPPFCSPCAHTLRAQTWKTPPCLHWDPASPGISGTLRTLDELGEEHCCPRAVVDGKPSPGFPSGDPLELWQSPARDQPSLPSSHSSRLICLITWELHPARLWAWNNQGCTGSRMGFSGNRLRAWNSPAPAEFGVLGCVK